VLPDADWRMVPGLATAARAPGDALATGHSISKAPGPLSGRTAAHPILRPEGSRSLIPCESYGPRSQLVPAPWVIGANLIRWGPSI